MANFEYKYILVGYVNEQKDEPANVYLSIKNTSDDPITINPGEKLFLNATHASYKSRNPKAPDYYKSVKVEKEENIEDSIPF